MPEMSDPEEASTYLARTNFKSVIEWLTAEAILNRPDDPLTFVRDLVDLKLHECGAAASEKTRASSDVFPRLTTRASQAIGGAVRAGAGHHEGGRRHPPMAQQRRRRQRAAQRAAVHGQVW